MRTCRQEETTCRHAPAPTRHSPAPPPCVSESHRNLASLWPAARSANPGMLLPPEPFGPTIRKAPRAGPGCGSRNSFRLVRETPDCAIGVLCRCGSPIAATIRFAAACRGCGFSGFEREAANDIAGRSGCRRLNDNRCRLSPQMEFAARTLPVRRVESIASIHSTGGNGDKRHNNQTSHQTFHGSTPCESKDLETAVPTAVKGSSPSCPTGRKRPTAWLVLSVGTQGKASANVSSD